MSDCGGHCLADALKLLVAGANLLSSSGMDSNTTDAWLVDNVTGTGDKWVTVYADTAAGYTGSPTASRVCWKRAVLICRSEGSRDCNQI